jgi:hypothetical protein
VTPGWLLLPSVKGTGKLTTDVLSVGTSTYGNTLEDRTQEVGPTRAPGSGLPTNDGGTSVHTRSLATVSNWNSNNQYVNTFLTDGSRTSKFTPTGGGWSVATVTTEGTHNYEWNGPEETCLLIDTRSIVRLSLQTDWRRWVSPRRTSPGRR